jgi:hypothetical protein
MKNYKHLIGLILALIWTGRVMAIEEPKYEVLRSDGPYEIRQYAPILIAETLVEGDMDEASNKGFRRIADFIFGNNQAADSVPQAKIAMTAPVTVEPLNYVQNMQSAEQWRINFVMPSQYSLASIPKPKNSAVILREVPSKRFVVLKYSGFNTASRVQSKAQETISWINNNNLKAIGTPQLSRYDPPWTLPMFRRNEIMIEISSP